MSDLQVRLGDTRFQLAVRDERLECSREKEVGGISIKREALDPAAWVGALTDELRSEAERSSEARKRSRSCWTETVADTPEIDEREQEVSLERIEKGELPLAAERRLKGLRDGGGRGFTSDLSVAEFALGHELGLELLSQVMGSCVYQVGWQYGYGGGYSWDGSMFEELAVLTEAWNEARSRALHRLAQEASLAGGNAVVGVHLRRGEHDWAEGGSSMW